MASGSAPFVFIAMWVYIVVHVDGQLVVTDPLQQAVNGMERGIFSGICIFRELRPRLCMCLVCGKQLIHALVNIAMIALQLSVMGFATKGLFGIT